MIVADIVAIILIALFCLLGLWLGFGKGLAFFTKGIFGFIISIFVCYCFGGLILNISFVNQLVVNWHNSMADKGGFVGFLALIRIEIIVYYIVLFFIVTILRIIIVKIIKSIVEIDNVFFKVVNKFFGIVFFFGVLILLTLLIFQIIFAFQGAEGGFITSLQGSFFGLDKLYMDNPFLVIIKIIRLEIVIPVS